PARWIALAELPLGSVGKVDRARLVALAAAETGQAEPADEIAGRVGGVWRELLGVPAVRGGDNFLDLGGNSLLAVQVASRIRDRLAVEVEPAEVLTSDTFADLVDRLRRAEA